MYGLIMNKYYINELINNEKTYDARQYYTNIRGTIGIIDSKSLKLVCLIDLVSVTKINSIEYVNWHLSGKYSNSSFCVDNSKTFYAYNFTNCKKIVNPIKIKKNGKIWCVFDDNILKNLYFTNCLDI